MWEINSIFQIIGFIYSILLGGLFCLIYDLIKSFRCVVKFSSYVVFIFDILYFILISVLSFIFFMAVTDGEIRFYILIGLLIGFVIFRVTISKIYIFILTKILKYLFWFFNKINSYILNFTELISSVFLQMYIYFKKILKNLKLVKKTLEK